MLIATILQTDLERASKMLLILEMPSGSFDGQTDSYMDLIPVCSEAACLIEVSLHFHFLPLIPVFIY